MTDAGPEVAAETTSDNELMVVDAPVNGTDTLPNKSAGIDSANPVPEPIGDTSSVSANMVPDDEVVVQSNVIAPSKVARPEEAPKRKVCPFIPVFTVSMQ